MVFCGKCGFQLTSGNITCPRCGTPTDAGSIIEDAQTNSPTIASSSIFGVNQSVPSTQGAGSQSYAIDQQPLVLGPNRDNYGAPEQRANETTSVMGSQPGQPPTRTSYPGFVPQSAANYSPQRASYGDYARQGGTAYQPFGTPRADAERVRARGRVVALLLILLGLLFILGAMVLFIVTHNATTTASSAILQAALLY
jgi:hypothetical protein